MNYYLFNKEQDYRRGQMENLRFDGGRLMLADAAGGPGRFLSRALDSREQETVWNRLFVGALIGGNMAVTVNLYASDSEAERQRIESGRNRRTIAQRTETMAGLKQMSVRNPEEVLLYSVRGRCLWIELTLWGDGQKGPEISLIQAFFPKMSWTAYLPELYRTAEPEFLERFLAVFETVYEQVERQIEESPKYLDLQAAPAEILMILGRWLNVDNLHLWPADRLRTYLQQGAGTYERRGTAMGLERTVEIFIGERPFIQEEPLISSAGEASAETLAHRFRLFLSEQAVPDQRTYQALKRIIREGKPADMEAEVIILRPWLVLGQHTYLGINSYLNDYQEALLDGQGMLGSTMLGGHDI